MCAAQQSAHDGLPRRPDEATTLSAPFGIGIVVGWMVFGRPKKVDLRSTVIAIRM